MSPTDEIVQEFSRGDFASSLERIALFAGMDKESLRFQLPDQGDIVSLHRIRWSESLLIRSQETGPLVFFADAAFDPQIQREVRGVARLAITLPDQLLPNSRSSRS
jgi:hypothetical protein